VIINGPAIGPRETNAAVGDLLKTESAFVHETVVTPALCRLLDYAAWMGWSRQFAGGS
jgi:hypothetical protein